jgi:hypothetical protein
VALGAAPVPYAASAVIPTTAAAVPLDPAAVSTATGGQLPLFGVLTLPGSDPDGGGGPVPYPYPGHVLTDEAGAPVGFAPGDLIALPFSAIQQLSRWDLSTASGSTPANFAAGQTYTFALMGDPAAEQLVGADGGQNPNYTGKGLHIVAFPNKFAPKQ